MYLYLHTATVAEVWVFGRTQSCCSPIYTQDHHHLQEVIEILLGLNSCQEP